MPVSITDSLSTWLEPGSIRHIGEVAVWTTGSAFYLCNAQDIDKFGPDSGASPTHQNPVDARQLAKLDTAGKFRPLKSAPSLQGDWLLELATIEKVREALDYLYPAGIALWLRWKEGKIAPLHLRETLNRQTGMYRVTGLIRDEEAVTLVRDTCAPEKCTRQILWDVSAELPLHLVREKRLETADEAIPLPQRVPLLCCEACNLLVAAARGAVKTRMASEADGS